MTVLQQWWHLEQPEVDPYWAYVRSLLHFNGDLTDSKDPNIPWGFAETAGITTSPVLAGTGALNCTNSRNDACVAVSRSELGIGTSDFCLEFCVYDPVVAVRGSAYCTYEGVGTSQTVRIFRLGTNGIFADVSGNGPDTPDVTMIPSVWNHVAVTRAGSNWTLWLNGAVAKSWVNSTLNGGVSGNLYLGRSTGVNTGSPSYYDEFRLTVGVPRYTAPFTARFPFPNRGP